MKYISSLALALAAVNTVSAQLGIDDRDVPAVCAPICQPLIQLSSVCSSESSTDSTCICSNTSFDVVDIGSMCAICCEQANALGSDLLSISAACSFTAGAYNQASASSVAATIVVTATHNGVTATVTPASETTASTSGSGSATAASTSGSGNAAPAPTMHAAGLLAGAGAIAAGLLL